MKKQFKLFALSVILLSLFSACSHSEKYKAEIKQLDSLSLLLDSAQLEFATIDTIKIHKNLEELIMNLDFIEKNNRDTISRERALLLSEYSSLREIFKEINKEYAKMGEELEESKKQIDNLIHDFKINKVEESKANIYLQDERIAAHRVIQSVEIISNMTKVYSEKFEIDNPKVLEVIKDLKN